MNIFKRKESSSGSSSPSSPSSSLLSSIFKGRSTSVTSSKFGLNDLGVINRDRYYAKLAIDDPLIAFLATEGEEFVYSAMILKPKNRDADEELVVTSQHLETDTMGVRLPPTASPSKGSIGSPSPSAGDSDDEDDDDLLEDDEPAPLPPQDDDDEEAPPAAPEDDEILEGEEAPVEKKKEWLLVVTKHAIYKMKPPARAYFKKIGRGEESQGMPTFKDVDAFISCVDKPLAPTTVTKIPHHYTLKVDKSDKNENEVRVISYRKNISSSRHLSSRMVERRFECKDVSERDTLVIMLNRVLQDYWQHLFEARLLKDNGDLYQSHVFVGKITRKGREQKRCLIFSGSKIYNYKLPPGVADPKKASLKWMLPVSVLEELRYYQLSPTAFGFKVNKEKAKSVATHFKNIHQIMTFNCIDTKQTIQTVKEIQRLYFLTLKQNLPLVVLNSEAEKATN